MFNIYTKHLLLSVATLSVLVLNTGCAKIDNTLASLTGNVTTDNSGDIWASISADVSTTDYGLASLNVPIVDPSNPTIEYGSISIAPVVCSGATSCVNGGLLTLMVNLTAVSNVAPSSTELPNGTAFPIVFSSASTKLVAIPVGGGGAKIYVAVGGGTYFAGAAIPFAGLDGAGKYTPGLDLFVDAPFDNDLITSYFGYFAGAGPSQTGIGLFADLSKLVASDHPGPSPAPIPVPSSSVSLATSTLKEKSNRPEKDQRKFLYHLWKLGHEEHPMLRYEQ